MGILSGISEGIVSNIVCGHFRKYAGPRCCNLKRAIYDDVDLFQLWVDNAPREGVHGLREARQWTRGFPKVQYMLTPDNVKRWLMEQGMRDIVCTVESTEGGEEWLDWQIRRFRTGLFGQ
ncbi:hypothetical protein [Methanomassiliicoccus luminyensis]|jgi:hypothetical protein|uniref:hypothetical protein n=1 Tax=Methanomassiliicoccus luminyensis TaxID=1080712 RepID=UPI00036C4337|nr:hypothetical protein [Methanomassiliicoccus luminyensis]